LKEQLSDLLGVPASNKATVWAPDGGKVKMRSEPSKDCGTYWNLSSGVQVDVVEFGNEWTHISTGTRDGYMMTQYLIFGEILTNCVDNDNITVSRKRLEDIYDELGDILGMRG